MRTGSLHLPREMDQFVNLKASIWVERRAGALVVMSFEELSH
jgi:hypothetical protein